MKQYGAHWRTETHEHKHYTKRHNQSSTADEHAEEPSRISEIVKVAGWL